MFASVKRNRQSACALRTPLFRFAASFGAAAIFAFVSTAAPAAASRWRNQHAHTAGVGQGGDLLPDFSGSLSQRRSG
jgi:hypothetical protein